ncbi:SDR family oxidoreductase [Mycolicibacterium palauense]|uniref:SDR family oxidoreductase n=1 Tax=Mycolicibacterium palauense TaxID=2034511 RepID=UPI000BFF0370|nr:SDR family oxidoreductase [Mycolicibacterium palauense]
MTRTVFITGAAAGIGRATALTLARKGYLVGAYDLDEAGLELLKADIEACGGRALTGRLDVTDSAEMRQRVDEFAAANGGRLDVMINNAGILFAGRFAEIDLSDQHKEIDVNCKGVVNGLYAAHRHLRNTPGAVALNLCSASAIYGQAELAVYSATKFFVRAMTEALDLEWADDGIRVIDMWPLFVGTGMLSGVDTATTRSLGVHLSAEDVAGDIAAALEPSRLSRVLHQVHFPVGVQTKVVSAFSQVAPSWLSRAVNSRLSH